MIETDRLILRRWDEADRAPFAALNADPRVMRYFPAPLTRAESDAMVDRIEAGIAANGFGPLAVALKTERRFIGCVGLGRTHPALALSPAIEIMWRLSCDAWGQGFAAEAANACLDLAFGALGFSEVVSFTAAPNTPSQKVMQRIGMHRDPARDFDHPLVADGSWLKPHLVYRALRGA